MTDAAPLPPTDSPTIHPAAPSIPHWADLHRKVTVIDIHAHPALKAALFHRDLARRSKIIQAFFWPPDVRTNFPALHAGGVDVLLSAIYTPEKRLLDDLVFLKLLRYAPWPSVRRTFHDLFDASYFTVTNGLLDDLERRLEQSIPPRPVELARSLDELNRLLAQRPQAPIVFVHTLEGGHALQGDTGSDAEILSNLEALFARGVASITLAHFYPNRLVMPVFPFPAYAQPLVTRKRLARLWRDLDLTEGLAPTGEVVVERMFELGMIVDVSHCTPPARRRIYEIAALKQVTSRVIASHVGAYAIHPTPYNLEDWEIRWMAEHGGLVGVIFMNYWLVPWSSGPGLDHISRTIAHLIKAAGGTAHHVALGTDFDGFTDPPDDLTDASQLPRLTQRLVAEIGSPTYWKYTDQDIENILGANALRVLRQGWGRREAAPDA